MPRATTPSFVYELKLQTSKKDVAFLDKLFFEGNCIYNEVVAHAKEQLSLLRKDEAYQNARSSYAKLVSEKNEDSSEFKAVKKIFNQRIEYYGLTEYALHSFVSDVQKQHKKIHSHVAQKQASACHQAVAKSLYSNGEEIHFRKLSQMHSLENKTSNTGFCFRKGRLLIGKRSICIQMPKHGTKERLYHNECLKCRVKYSRIIRRMFPSGWQYYIHLILEGVPPKKNRRYGSGAVGIDLGTSTVAVSAERGCILTNLNQAVKSYEKEIAAHQEKMDRILRVANKENYHPNGTIRKGKKAWIRPKSWKKHSQTVATLFRRQREGLKHVHGALANRILVMGNQIYVEKMSIAGLAKRAETLERKETPVETKKPDGSTQEIHPYKRTKRFGKSIGVHAPAQLIAILNRKLGYIDQAVITIDTVSFKASQYDHVADTYEKHTLDERTKTIGGHLVQRDLYSAFLLMNANPDGKNTDRNKCLQNFEQFIINQTECLNALKESGQKNPCFGLEAFAA